jgi:uncharacterized protein
VRVVLDPNVLVSAVISPLGPSAQIVSAWSEGRFELILSATLLAELGEVLARPKFRRWISHDAADEFVRGIQESALTIDDPPAQSALSPDPDDDYLIALARFAEADYLVSGDGHLTGLAAAEPPVLTPRVFLEHLSNG